MSFTLTPPSKKQRKNRGEPNNLAFLCNLQKVYSAVRFRASKSSIKTIPVISLRKFLHKCTSCCGRRAFSRRAALKSC